VDVSELVDAVRRHIRIVIGMVVLAVVVAGAYVYFRRETRPPDQFRAVSIIQIPERVTPGAPKGTPQPAVTAGPGTPEKLLRGQDSLAVSSDVTKKALSDSGIPNNEASVKFGAALNSAGEMTLTVTSLDDTATSKVIANYVQAFLEARRAISADAIRGTQQGAQDQLNTLQSSLRTIESQLHDQISGPLPPIVLSPSLSSGTSQNGTGGRQQQQQQQLPVPSIPGGVDSNTELLLFQRNALANRITQIQLAYADNQVNSNVPSAYADVIDTSNSQRIVGTVSKPIVPVAIILLLGLGLGLAGAVLIDRRDNTIRSARGASSTLSAPILSTIQAPRRGRPEYAALERPHSKRSAEFRRLAATCLTTDRLPRAIMVSTPEGDTCDDVAANFAAGLASLGLYVALVATSPRQSWYLERFTVPVDGGNLSDLLEQAHQGQFNGEAGRKLAFADVMPNLMVVPPAPDAALTVPLDSLGPFLDALAHSGIDVTVIAGPPLLEDADATLVAWETRSVLWAVQVGVVTRRGASEAAARLELANVTPFGVVIVGAPED
jgi:Mrp family chromosome partitioning ATPase